MTARQRPSFNAPSIVIPITVESRLRCDFQLPTASCPGCKQGKREAALEAHVVRRG